MPLRLRDGRAVQEEVLARLVTKLAVRHQLQLQGDHITRGRARLEQAHGHLAAQPPDELVQDEKRRRSEGIVPEGLGMRPEQHQHDHPQLVHAHEQRVTAEGEFTPSPLAPAHALERRDEHKDHADQDEEPREAAPRAKGLLAKREARTEIPMPDIVGVVARDVADPGDGDQHGDRLVEVDLLAERQNMRQRRRAQPRDKVAQHREEDEIAQHVEHAPARLGMYIPRRRVLQYGARPAGEPPADEIEHPA